MAENNQEKVVSPAQFSALSGDGPEETQENGNGNNNLEFLMDVSLQVAVELGRTQMTIREVLSLTPGSVIELSKIAGEPVDILVNGKPMARGEVVVIDDMFGVRVTDIIPPGQRVQNLR